DEPIRAKRPSLLHRLRRVARRHKPVVWSAGVSAVLVLVLAVIALALSRWRIGQAERQAKHQLVVAWLDRARASRYGRHVGQRLDSWKALADAARLARELGLGEPVLAELRDEAVACLALTDVRLGHEWPGFPPGSTAGMAFDADLERYARSDLKGNLSIRSVGDDRELARLPGQGAGGVSSGAAVMQFSPDGRWLAVRHWPRAADDPHAAFRLRVWY